MRLSTAMALGRTTVPCLLATKLEGCALGMAGNAVGLKHWFDGNDRFDYVDLEREWPWLKVKTERCHLCGIGINTNLLLIAHIFDSHIMEYSKRWTLDQLIDFVRTIEPNETETAIEQIPKVVTQITQGAIL